MHVVRLYWHDMHVPELLKKLLNCILSTWSRCSFLSAAASLAGEDPSCKVQNKEDRRIQGLSFCFLCFRRYTLKISLGCFVFRLFGLLFKDYPSSRFNRYLF
jgi:hypothetical protein